VFKSNHAGLPPLATFVDAAGTVLKKLFAMHVERGTDAGGEPETIVARVPMAPAGLTMVELRMPREAAARLVEMWTGGEADDEMAGDAVRELAETIAAVGYGKSGGVTRCARLSTDVGIVGRSGEGVACRCEAGTFWVGFAGGAA